MKLSLRADVQQFIDEQVNSGRFPTPEAVVEAAITDWRSGMDVTELDDDAIAAINQAEAQADRGEGMELADFREHLRKRIPGM